MIVDELVTLLKFDVKGGEKAEKFKESLEAMTDGAKKVVLGIGGMITAVAAFADKVSRELTENYRWAKSLGVAADSYQRFDYAAKLIGGSLDSIKGDLAEWVRTAQAQGRTLEEVFLDEAKSVEHMSAAQSHAFLSARGYSEEAIRLLQQGQAELSRTLAQADVIPEEQLRAAEDYVKTWELFSSEIKQVMYGAVAQALPALREILQNIREFLFQNKDSIRHFIISFFTAAVNMTKMLYRSLRPFLDILGNAVKWLSKMTDGSKESTSAIRLLEIGIKALLAVFAVSVIVNFVTWLGTLASAIWTVVAAVVGFSATLLTTPIGWFILLLGALAAAIYLVYTNWDQLVEFFKVFPNDPLQFFINLLDVIEKVNKKINDFIDKIDLLPDWMKYANPIGALAKLGEWESQGAGWALKKAKNWLGGNEEDLNMVSTSGSAIIPNNSYQNSHAYNDNRNITINTNATSGPAIASYLQNNDLIRSGYGSYSGSW